MTVYLLGDVAEEREAAVMRDGSRERAQHLRREVLPFINDDVAVAAFPVISLQLVDYGTGQVGPVVRFTVSLTLTHVASVEIEQRGAFRSRYSGCRPTETLCCDVVSRIGNAMPLNPLKLLIEELCRTSEYWTS